ncbi:MAG TPA: response regulator [Longimicrobiales bacterium]|nr:response regulator [Longimicrobiales bacterium]
MVLIVDASADLRFIYAEMLRRNGIDTAEAGSRAEALRVARERRPAALVIDSSASDGEGARLVAELGRDSRTAAIPVIFLRHWSEGPPPAASAPVVAVRKPVDPRELLGAVQELLQRARRQTTA